MALDPNRWEAIKAAHIAGNTELTKQLLNDYKDELNESDRGELYIKLGNLEMDLTIDRQEAEIKELKKQRPSLLKRLFGG